MKLIVRFVLVVLFAQVLVAQEIIHQHNEHAKFWENKGQWHKDVLFRSQFSGGNLWIQQHKFIVHFQDFSQVREVHEKPRKHQGEQLNVRQSLVHVNFEGSNAVSQLEKLDPSKSYRNYFIGNDPSRWASNVKGYSEVILRDIYNKIDLKFIEQGEELKYEFHIAPHADPSQIKLSIAGADELYVDKTGNLIIKTEAGSMMDKAPYTYQIKHGKLIEISCRYKVVNEQVLFDLGTYDPQLPLVIDPILVFATYSGSVTDNFGMTATYGHDGTAYSAGTVFGNAYPVPDPNAFDIASNFTLPTGNPSGITDVFLSKYAPDGKTMLWSTYLGGGNSTTGTETAQSLICDRNNNVYIYGSTSSQDFPIVGGAQAAHAGGVAGSNFVYNGVYFTQQGTDIYVAKISANGHQLLASTYLGGAGNDGVNYHVSSGLYNSVSAYDSLTSNYGDQFRGEIMLDKQENCWIASSTHSTNFPVVNPMQANNHGGQDGVLIKLNNSLSSVLWSSYFGGSKNDACYSVKIDSNEAVVFCGGTSSNDIAGMTGWQQVYGGGKADGFVAKLKPQGYALEAASYLGLTNYDQAFFVEINRNNHVFLLGQSNGGQFPVLNAGYSNPNSGQFIAEFNPDLGQLLHATVFGNGNGGVNISPAAFLVDVCGNIYVSGWGANILQGTQLNNMPTTSDAYQPNSPNGFDFYLFVLNSDFSALKYASYLGGSQAQEHVDGGTSRFDKYGIVYQSVCGGCGGHSDFPTTSDAWSQQNLSSNCNNVVFKFDFQLLPKASFTADETSGCAPLTIDVSNLSTLGKSYTWDLGNGSAQQNQFDPVISYSLPGNYLIRLFVLDSVCLLTDTATISITVYPELKLEVSPGQDFCFPEQVELIANSFGTSDHFSWSTSPTFTNLLNTDNQDSTISVLPQQSTTYYVKIWNDGCSKVDSVIITVGATEFELNGNASGCLGDTLTFSVDATFNNPPQLEWKPSELIVGSANLNEVKVLAQDGEYVHVYATLPNGCVIHDSVLLVVGNIDTALVDAKATHVVVPQGGITLLMAEPSGYSYVWTPDQGLQQPTQQQTTATVPQTTCYTVEITDNGCKKKDTVWVKTYGFVCGDPYIFIPNAFSPNGDHENDQLLVRGDVLEKMIFRVYSRWGELLFETQDRGVGWDGTFKGKPMDPDVYDYYLQGTCYGGYEFILKGNVTLIH